MTEIQMDNPWVIRYERLLSLEEIRRRARKLGQPVEGLNADPIEVASDRLLQAFKSVFYPTNRCCEIIRDEIERALAHALAAYPDKSTMLQRCYEEHPRKDIDPYVPACFTGLAGTGKTELERALARVLSEIGTVNLGPGGGLFPMISYISVSVRGAKSVARALRPLAAPEIANGSTRVAEADLPLECARWLFKTGVCSFGVDELQFMTQSANATTLVTKTLLGYGEVRVPWHFVSNYSWCWRLMRRPQEATQRLLGCPVVLMPDPPQSEDWLNVLAGWEIVVGTYFSFKFSDLALALWVFCAGLKRELVKLLVHSYRICRRRAGLQVEWTDVEMAYASLEFCASRQDIELLIAHAAQGGDLKEDLRCPFVGGAIAVSQEQYFNSLQVARAGKVAVAARDASMNVDERQAAKAIQSRTEPTKAKPLATVTKMPPKKRTLESLQEAGRFFKNKRAPDDQP